jgi:hypothetical protein
MFISSEAYFSLMTLAWSEIILLRDESGSSVDLANGTRRS